MKLSLSEKNIISVKLRIFISLLAIVVLTTNSIEAQQKVFKVVLDAGHGGKDPGKVGYKRYKEKDIALKIVFKIGEILNKNKNIEVIYTRKTDVFVDLVERGAIANRVKADAFVSIHCNAHSSQAKGSETWVLGLHENDKNFKVAQAENSAILWEDNYKEKYNNFDPNSPESTIGITFGQEDYLDLSLSLASYIQANLKKKLKRVNRGVKQSGFIVLHQTFMPSVLIETGFITNKKEALYLNSKKGQQDMANSIASAIEKYVAEARLNYIETTVPVIASKNGYRVQIAVGSLPVEVKSYNFRGLKNIVREKKNGKYYYFLKTYYSRKKAENSLKKANKKGYKTAFIVKVASEKLTKTYSAEKNTYKNNDKPKSRESQKTQSSGNYTVLLASSRNKINPASYNFKGIKGVKRFKERRVYSINWKEKTK